MMSVLSCALAWELKLPEPLDSVLSYLLLEHVPNAELYFACTIVALLVGVLVQLHAFTRPPPVPLKQLPRRPTLQIIFKPDDDFSSAPSATNTATASASAKASRRDDVSAARTLTSLYASFSDHDEEEDDNLSGISNASERPEPPRLHTQDLPDSFAPLLSSSEMEFLFNQLTADLIHAVHLKGGVRLREGRHEIPLDRDQSRPQFIVVAPKGGCRITAAAGIGSDGFSSQQDLDVSQPVRSRSRPMVKHAGIVLDPPLQLQNVAPTLIHFPTLFEDNVVPTLRRRQILRFALDLLISLSSFIEKILWIIESKCQVHLSKIRVTPLYKGRRQTKSSTDGSSFSSPQWRLDLAFSGHVSLFGWIPIPFISVTLPTFIIPQPHALLEYLLTAQPLASAKLKRENVDEQKIMLALLDMVDRWNLEATAVATPPAVMVDLTLPGGLTLAFEMMHGRDATGVRHGGVSSPSKRSGGIPESISGDSLSTWGSHSVDVNMPQLSSTSRGKKRGPTASTAIPPEESTHSTTGRPSLFDANALVPWLLEASVTGSVSKDKLTLKVKKLAATHEDIDPFAGTATNPMKSKMSVSGSMIICRGDPYFPSSSKDAPPPDGQNRDRVGSNGDIGMFGSSSSISSGGHPKSPYTRPSRTANVHLAALNYTKDSPSICSLLLFPETYAKATSKRSSRQFLEYDYEFDIGDDTQLDAVSVSVGASHPMLKGGTIITTVLESIYAFGTLCAREGAALDPSEKPRKRNILRHLPAVDVSAGIQNAYSLNCSYSDDGQTKSIPEMQGGRIMIRAVGGVMPDDLGLTPPSFTPNNGGSENMDGSLLVSDGIKFIVDFGISSFSLNSESHVKEFPELDIFEGTKCTSFLSATTSGRVSCHLRPQNLSLPTNGPSMLNPLEAYEIDFADSSVSLRIKEFTSTLGHRRIIIPTETTFNINVVESVVDMSFEGKTQCELSWDFQGSSPILQVTSVGHSPANATHENKHQVSLLIPPLRQGRFNFHVSSVGGIQITQAVTSRENREGLYDWKFFNAIVSPDDSSGERMMNVIHDKRTMQKVLQIVKLINSDLEQILRHLLTQIWKCKDILDQEGVSDPAHLIPGHKMARFASLFLCGDDTQTHEIRPIIARVTAGDGLDVVKAKELLRKYVHAYDNWAPEIDRAVRWIDVLLGPMVAPQPYVENHVPALSELPCFAKQLAGVPSAKHLYAQLLDRRGLSLDPAFSNMVSRVAPYMTFRQIEYILSVRLPTDWQPSDLRRLRYVYSVKKKVLAISESYGGLSFLPQSFLVSVFVGEATRASLRASGGSHRKRHKEEQLLWPSLSQKTTSTLSSLRKRRMAAPKTSSSHNSSVDNDFIMMSPASRVASKVDFVDNAGNKLGTTESKNIDGSISETSQHNSEHYELGDSLLGPCDVAILLQAGLASSLKSSTVVQLNQRMLLDLMASQPTSFALAVLAEIGTPGGQGSIRSLTSALMALLELDQSSFTEIHRLNMHTLLEEWLSGLKIPRREDYLAGGRWARQSYYEAVFGVAKDILDDAECYMALKSHIQRVRHQKEEDPIPIPKELESLSADMGINIDEVFEGSDVQNEKYSDAIATAKTKISIADQAGQNIMLEVLKDEKQAKQSEKYQKAIDLYREAFDSCAAVLTLDNLAFHSPWFKSFFRRNYDALMVKSVHDNIVNNDDHVRKWLDALQKGVSESHASSESISHHTLPHESMDHSINVDSTSPGSTKHQRPTIVVSDAAAEYHVASSGSHCPGLFLEPEEHAEQEIVDGIIDLIFYDENERKTIRQDPLVRLLISNPPGKYDFTIVSAMGVITEGSKGTELAAALHRLEGERGVKTIRADTGNARSFEYNASKIEQAVEKAVELRQPYGLLGYSQGCANVLTAESLLLSGNISLSSHGLFSR